MIIEMNAEHPQPRKVDKVAHILSNGGLVAYPTDTVYGIVFKGVRYDAGDRLGFIKANINYALKDDDLGPRLKQFIAERVSRES